MQKPSDNCTTAVMSCKFNRWTQLIYIHNLTKSWTTSSVEWSMQRKSQHKPNTSANGKLANFTEQTVGNTENLAAYFLNQSLRLK